MSSAYEVVRLSQVREKVTMWVRMKPLILGPLFAFYFVVHAAAGVDARRLSVMAAIWGALIVAQLGRRRRSQHELATEEQAFRAAFVHIAAHATVLALTGGVRSALLPSVFGPCVGAVLTHGRSRRSDAAIVTTIGALVVVALLPTSLVGARIPAPYDVVVSVVSIAAALLLVRYTTLMVFDANRTVGESLGRMRDDLLVHATERARTLESVSARVAHELKNPLAAVKGLVQLMARGASADDRAKERLRVVGDEVTRMEDILRNYLSLSRPVESLRRGPVEVAMVADDVVAVLEARAEQAGVRIRADVEAALVTGDAYRLKEAVFNLAANAIEATPRGGSVTLTVRRSGASATLTVEDTGMGMTPEVLARVGTAYFTTRAEGTGLGVVLARALIEQHGGTLTYTSEPGVGTRATVTLPEDGVAREAA